MPTDAGRRAQGHHPGAMRTRRLRPPLPIDLRRSLAPLIASGRDPTIRVGDAGAVRAMRTPQGPATLELGRDGDAFIARGWGPGADWALHNADGLLGMRDDLAGFCASAHPEVERAHRRLPGLRLIRSGLVEEVLVPTILAQRVTAGEAARAWTRMVRRWGEPAPGPHGLLLPPEPSRLATTPYWAFHELGVERARARAISAACRRIDRLQEAVDMPPTAAAARLTSLGGIGPWTAALVLRAAAGHADAVEVGDYHVKHHVGWALAGEPRATDERMLELLAPFVGHRGRAVRLLLAAARPAPTFGPRRRVVAVDTL